MSVDAQWISAIANVITTAGIWLLWKQVCLLKLQLSYDHERSRREKAVDLCMEWSKSLRQNTSMARKLADKLSEEQARMVWKGEALRVDKSRKSMVDACFDGSDGLYEEKDDDIIIHPRGSALLRWHLVGYLNVLESILSARRHNVADREIIKEEFRYLVEETKGNFILRSVRQAAGGINTYPAIEEFVRELEQDSRDLAAGKKPLLAVNR